VTKKTFNKLVRDRIPEIIEGRGGVVSTRILGDAEYLTELNKKLQEEVTEYLQAQNHETRIEELADLLAVIETILGVCGETFVAVEKVKVEKEIKRGSFSKRIFLETVEE